MRHFAASIVFALALLPAGLAAGQDCPRARALELSEVRAELTCLLQAYVRIDTTNPPGNERRSADFVAAVLEREGLDAQVLESAPGRANLYARLRGTGAGKAVALMHHMDVVPAMADEWSVAPFSGELREGAVWGRGSLDNKGGGSVGLVTFLLLHRLGVELERDVVLLGVADEEAGGGLGARWLLAEHPALFEDVEYVLNEGGGILRSRNGQFLYRIELAQKAPLWLRLRASGPSGHGSSPQPAAAPHVLVRALARLEAHRFPITVLPEVQQVFTHRARAMPQSERAPYLDLGTSLRDPTFRKIFLADPRQATLVRHSLSITQLEGSDKENVIPATASAVLDLRVLPGHDPREVVAEVVQVMDEPAIEVETLLSWEGHPAPRDTALFRAIEAHAARRHPGASVAANFIAGFTDCNAFRAAGITCYGFLPVVFAPSDFSGVHGRDERARVAPLAEAVLDLFALLRSLPAS